MREAQDEVFNDEALNGSHEPLASDVPEKKSKVGRGGKMEKSPGELFAATAEEKAAEARRIHDKRIGVIIGAKGLASLRTFGYDVVHVQDAPLSSGVAHRGLD